MAMIRDGVANGKRIEFHKFVQADVDSNHNKFWNVGLYDSGDVEIEHGRIGVTNTRWVQPNGGRSFMDRKIREKKNGKIKGDKREYYRELQTLDGDFSTAGTKPIKNIQLKSIAKEQISHTSAETAKLIEWLAEVNRHSILDNTTLTYHADSGLFQTPMGIVTPNSISQARSLLVDIGVYISKGNYSNKTFRDRVNDYLMLIPQNVGMKLKIENVFPDLTSVQQQGQILDSLDASYVSATTIVAPKDDTKDDAVKPKVFETKLSIISDSVITKKVEQFFYGSRNKNHYNVYGMKIREIWAVEISSMQKAFEVISKKIDGVVELWHGTQASNCLSILKGGLVIPPSSSPHVTGRMFSDGVYASDQSTKALNYATSFWGGRDIGRYFMFLLDMAMGKTYVPHGPEYNLPKFGFNSTLAVGRSDQEKVKRYGYSSGVSNNEMIVYKTSQVNLKYLIELRR